MIPIPATYDRELTREEIETATAYSQAAKLYLSRKPSTRMTQLKMALLAMDAGKKPVVVPQIKRPDRPHRLIGLDERYAAASYGRLHTQTLLTQTLQDPSVIGQIVLCYGPPGTGKTWAGAAFLMDHAQFDQTPNGWWTDALYMRSGQVVDILGFEEEKRRRRDALASKHLVFIDDIPLQTSEAWQRWFFEFIDARYRKQLTTLLATNMSYEQFQLTMPAPVLDRLAESGVFIETKWGSFRQR